MSKINDIFKENNDTTEKNETEEIIYYDSYIKKVEEAFTSENYDTSDLDDGKDEIIETKKVTFTLTTTQNQKRNFDNNMTTVDLGECETLLRNFYNLSNNETLYMKKLDIVQEGMKTKKIEYDVYCKLSGTNLEKLNLSVCQESKIILSLPISISEDIDKLNISSGYYNDICYVTTSDSGTDISLKDRKKEYVNGNKTICQEDCDFSEYDTALQKAKCSCEIKQSSSSIVDMNLNKTKLFENFKDIKNLVNINILKCYKTLLNKIVILHNIGFYILVIILLFHIICTFIFYMKQLSLIKEKINDLIFAIKNLNILKDSEKKQKNKNTENKEVKNKKTNKNENTRHKKKDKKKKNKGNLIQKNITHNIDFNNNKININKRKQNNIIAEMDFSNINMNSKQEEQTKINKIKNIMEYKNDEINILPYELAIKQDKRTFIEYYISLLKSKHSLLFAFSNNNDYNSKIIKIDLFIVSFAIYYTVNALFFNDDAMHKIYESKGSFDFEYQLPIIAYSSLISMFLNTLLKLLALSNDSIINFKQNHKSSRVQHRGKKLYKQLCIRFVLYFIISFIFLLGFWYYISMFGAIYRNTQLHLLKDTVISFGLSFLYPFIIYLFPGIFRISSLKNSLKKRELLYNFSKVLQLF